MGVGQGHVHYKVLLKIILQSAVLLPVDYDILYMDDCIYDRLHLLSPQEGKQLPPYVMYYSTTERFYLTKPPHYRVYMK